MLGIFDEGPDEPASAGASPSASEGPAPSINPKPTKGTGVIPVLEPPPPSVTAVSRILSGRIAPAWTAISLRVPKNPARLATGATIPGV